MREEEFQSVLRSVDIGRRPFSPAELSARVRAARRWQRRRRRAMAGACVPLVMVLAIVGWWTTPHDKRQVAETTSESVEMPQATINDARIARWKAEAERHERTARLLLASARNSTTGDHYQPAAFANKDPFASMHEQVDIVAYRMILRADELHADMGTTAEALEIYRRVARELPNTYSAEVARQRLNEAINREGESS